MKDKIKEEKVLNLYYEGLNDNQIGKIVNCSTESVRNVRLKYKLKSNFNYSQRWVVDEILLEDLVKKGLHDKEISNKLKVSEKSVSEARKRYGIKRPAYNIAKKILSKI